MSVSYRPGEWFPASHFISRNHAQYIKPRGVAVWVALASRADKKGECWPSIPTLMRESGMSRNSVRDTLKALEKYGLIEMEESIFTAPNGKKWKGWLYTLLDPSPAAVSLRQGQGANSDPHNGENKAQGVKIDRLRGCKNAPRRGLEFDPEVDLEEVDSQEDAQEISQCLEEKAEDGLTQTQRDCPHPDHEVYRSADDRMLCHKCYLAVDHVKSERFDAESQST